MDEKELVTLSNLCGGEVEEVFQNRFNIFGVFFEERAVSDADLHVLQLNGWMCERAGVCLFVSDSAAIKSGSLT